MSDNISERSGNSEEAFGRTVETAINQNTRLPVDGVVCFGGEDWWYHNRGHFDMQIMRQLSTQLPVLYVNSLGMRMPKLNEGGSVFLKRVFRKLASVRRGTVAVDERFHVFSPFNVPGNVLQKLSKPFLRFQLRRAIRKQGFVRPLIWVALPTAHEILPSLPRGGLVYQRTDHFESFPGIDRDKVLSWDRALKKMADLTVFCSHSLMDREGGECRLAAFIDHGVDFDRFAAAASQPEPDDVRDIPRPRVGFVGAIDPHTFDTDFFGAVVERLPDLEFVMVGGCTLADGWMDRPNVHFLGQKPYEDVWRYPGVCDVLIMPWNKSTWIQNCNPVKLKEYLAAGRPVVTTSFDELRRYEGYVRVADNPDDFAAAIRATLADHGADPDGELQNRVRDDTWSNRGMEVFALLSNTLSEKA